MEQHHDPSHQQPAPEPAVERDEQGRWVRPPVGRRFQAGQSGNPKGRPNLGMSIREWLNTMGEWRIDQILAVLDDTTQPVAKRVAARQLVIATSDDDRVAGQAFDRVMDYTGGKPVNRTEVSGPNGGPIRQQDTVSEDPALAAMTPDEHRVMVELRRKAMARLAQADTTGALAVTQTTPD